MKLILDRDRQQAEQHAVRLVEEEGARQERQHHPLVVLAHQRSLIVDVSSSQSTG